MKLFIPLALFLVLQSIPVVIGNGMVSSFLYRLFGIGDSEDLIRIRTTTTTTTTTTEIPTTRKRKLPHESHSSSHSTTCGAPSDMFQSNKRRFARVVGGFPAPRGYHTYIGAIRRVYSSSNVFKQFCGATLIHPKFLLTAAHCLVGESVPQLDVVVGTEDEDSKQIMNIERVHPHPHFRGSVNSWADDIALIELKTEVTLTKFVSLACLPDNDFNFHAGRLCMVSGWGDEEVRKKYSNRLQVGLVPIIDRASCMNHSSSHSYKHLPRHSFCAGYTEGRVDTCQGDSGGPFVCQENGLFYAVGVTSWGIGCAEFRNPGVYTKVTGYLDWIDRIINKDKYDYSDY